MLRFFRLCYRFMIGSMVSVFGYGTFKVYLCNHLTIGLWGLYKQKTKFPHPVGIVIGLKVLIGKNCVIYQNVTIGTKQTNIGYKESLYPRIGDNVTIYPNSMVIGDISVGDNVVIGAGSIVLEDIPDNSVVKGAPAKILRKIK